MDQLIRIPHLNGILSEVGLNNPSISHLISSHLSLSLHESLNFAQTHGHHEIRQFGVPGRPWLVND